jgi:hypothetical protein
VKRQQRLAFREILAKEEGRIASTLEHKAIVASWLAKAYPQKASAFYSLKHTALRQLFRVRGSTPIIRDAWTTSRGFLLSVRLVSTNSLLHIPFDQLLPDTQLINEARVAELAKRKWWRPVQRQKHAYRTNRNAA